MVNAMLKLGLFVALAAGMTVFAQEGDMDFRLVEHLWQLESYQNVDGEIVEVVAGSQITAGFENGVVNGEAGCNQYFGSYSINNAEITITDVGSTMMACADEAVMQQETAYLDALRRAASYQIVDDQLQFSNADGAVILTYSILEPAPLVETIWTMTGYNNGQGGVVGAMPDAEVTAIFSEDGLLAGSGGCNSYSAAYETNGMAMTISEIVSTLMACADDDVMEQEQAYLAALENVSSYEIRADVLRLYGSSGEVLARFEAKPAIVGIEWQWQRAEPETGESVTVPNPADYTLQFDENGRFGVVADCNQGSGTYTLNGTQINLEVGPLTRVACPPESLSNDFLQHLASVESFEVDGDTLRLMPGANGEVLVFAAG